MTCLDLLLKYTVAWYVSWEHSVQIVDFERERELEEMLKQQHVWRRIKKC